MKLMFFLFVFPVYAIVILSCSFLSDTYVGVFIVIIIIGGVISIVVDWMEGLDN